MKLSIFALILLVVLLPASGQQIVQLTSVTVPAPFNRYKNFFAANWNRNELYVPNPDSLTVVDTTTWSVKKTIPLEFSPSRDGMCISPGGIIGIPTGARITIVNPETGETRHVFIEEFISPSSGTSSTWGCSFSTDGNTLFVSSGQRLGPADGSTEPPNMKKLAAIRTADWTVTGAWRVVVGGAVQQILALPNGKVYAQTYNTPKVDGITAQVWGLRVLNLADGSVKTVDVGLAPNMTAITPKMTSVASGSRVVIVGLGTNASGGMALITFMVDTATDEVIDRTEVRTDKRGFGSVNYAFPSDDDPWFGYDVLQGGGYDALQSGIEGVNLYQKVLAFSSIIDQGETFGLVANRQPDGSDILALRRDGRVDIYKVTPATAYAVTNAGSFSAEPSVSPGEWIAIFGRWPLPTEGVKADRLPLPTQLGGVQVFAQVGNAQPIALPLNFVGGGQINAVFPFEIPTGEKADIWAVGPGDQKTNILSVNVVPATPAAFAWPDRSPIVTDAGGNLISSVNRGSTVVMYFNGLGQVNPPVPSGSAAPISPLSWAVAKPEVLLGGMQCNVQYYGLVPTLASLYQLNVVIPSGAPTGKQTLLIRQAGNNSPEYNITISGGSN